MKDRIDMKKTVQRFLIFFLGIPLLIALVFFLPARNHLALNLLVAIVSILGAMEFQNILKQKGLFIPLWKAALFGGLIPALACAEISFNFNRAGTGLVFMAAISSLILSGIFSAPEKQNLFISRVAAGFSVIIYPGLFLSWIIPMALLPKAAINIIVYLLIVFMNDSAAWAAGMLFGKGNQGIFPVSPQKSIAGYAGGTLASVLIAIGGSLLFPEAFASRLLPLLPAGVVLGLCTSIMANLGDLGESVLKRSAGIKDSGMLIPGRGGILDSIDSHTLAAPVYYLFYRLLFVC